MLRTHSCGELRVSNVGENVVLTGWVNRKRNHGNLLFVDLRDRFGLTQIVFNSNNKKVYELAKSLENEFVVKVKGLVQKRLDANPDLKTGEVEVVVEELIVLNKCKQPLPVEVSGELIAKEDTRLEFRYLDLRRKQMQDNLVLRHRVIKLIRDYFDEHDFLEIETPILAKSTPEGARDFLVPSRLHKGNFFALPQSPQLFKQILMISGFDKYMQIAKCFRDEDLRADRQLEFTQLDLEMSFVEEEDIYELIEGMLKKVMKEIKGVDIGTPFNRLTFKQAMNEYGSDKPDTRFGLKLIDLTSVFSNTSFNAFKETISKGGVVKAIVVPNGVNLISGKKLKKIVETAKIFKAKGLIDLKVLNKSVESMVTKFLTKKEIDLILEKTSAGENDLILLVADSWKKACTIMGEVRLKTAKLLELVPENKFNFLWVTDFPMFELDEEDNKIKAMHHPFTSPKEIDLLESKPLEVNSRAYDVVMNGVELGGGSIRIHSPEIQKKVFKAIGLTQEQAENKFGFLLKAFEYGAPPHGGIALGLDRFIMLLAGENSIREVIAFPKNKAGASPMDSAPSKVSEKQLTEQGIQLIKKIN